MVVRSSCDLLEDDGDLQEQTPSLHLAKMYCYESLYLYLPLLSVSRRLCLVWPGSFYLTAIHLYEWLLTRTSSRVRMKEDTPA